MHVFLVKVVVCFRNTKLYHAAVFKSVGAVQLGHASLQVICICDGHGIGCTSLLSQRGDSIMERRACYAILFPLMFVCLCICQGYIRYTQGTKLR